MGARRRKKSDDDHTASEDPWVPRWLPVLGNRQRHSDVGEETKEKVQQKCGGAECGVREKSMEKEREKNLGGERKTEDTEDELITADDRLHVYVCHVTPRG